MKKRVFFYLFVVASVVNIFSGFFSLPELNQYSKPLLMPLLIYYMMLEADGVITLPRLLLGLALLFSWIGDVLLLWESEELYFLGGLGSFLAAHITYCVIFVKASYGAPRINLKAIWPLLVYGVVLIAWVGAHAGQMLPAIVIYGLCIMTMAAIALLRKGQTLEDSFQWVVSGAILFIVSDSVLAVNKFVFDVPLAKVVIMSTYLSAQYYLVKGVLAHPG